MLEKRRELESLAMREQKGLCAAAVEKYSKTSRYRYFSHYICHDIVIVEQASTPAGYFAVVDGKRSDTMWPTFEEALLCAVSLRMTGREAAAEWALKLMR